MKKQKICFDTSTISSLFDNSSNTHVVTSLFDFLSENSELFRLFISPVFEYEISSASQSLIDKISEIVIQFKIVLLPISKDAIKLSEFYVNQNVLAEKHYHDLTHIAYASLFSCNYFISCDINHIVRKRTIDFVQNINTAQNIFVPTIITPLNFMENFK
jgi:hypothetical protein